MCELHCQSFDFQTVVNCSKVEVEGFEPSSKRGISKVSTCLVIDLVFEERQARDYQPFPYPFYLGGKSRMLLPYFRISQHRFVQTSRNRAMERCLVRFTLKRIKEPYCTSGYAARA